MKEITFVGSGINGSSLRDAISNSFRDPSGLILPFGANWPLVRLSANKEMVEFKMPYGIHKSAKPLGVKIRLSKIGYLYFQTSDSTKDFGFATFRMTAMIRELKTLGYHLDESCERNLPVAKFLMPSMTIIGAVALVVGAILMISGIQGN